MPNDRMEQIQLTPQQKQNFSANLKTGALKELKKKGFLTSMQVQKIWANEKH